MEDLEKELMLGVARFAFDKTLETYISEGETFSLDAVEELFFCVIESESDRDKGYDYDLGYPNEFENCFGGSVGNVERFLANEVPFFVGFLPASFEGYDEV